jgi:hypothetical protein
LAHNLHVQTQGVGYFRSLPSVLRQTQDSGASVAHDIVSSLPLIQNNSLVGRDGSCIKSHNNSHGAILAQKVKISRVKQH